jgi:hypothetical protein
MFGITEKLRKEPKAPIVVLAVLVALVAGLVVFSEDEVAALLAGAALIITMVVAFAGLEGVEVYKRLDEIRDAVKDADTHAQSVQDVAMYKRLDEIRDAVKEADTHAQKSSHSVQDAVGRATTAVVTATMSLPATPQPQNARTYVAAFTGLIAGVAATSAVTLLLSSSRRTPA